MRQTFSLIYVIAGAGLIWLGRDQIRQTLTQLTKKKGETGFEQSTLMVDMLKVTKAPMKRTLSFPGVIANRNLIKIKPERGGEIKFLEQKIACKQGQLLVEFVNDFEEAAVVKQESLLTQAEANLRRYKNRILQNPVSASDAERLTHETGANTARAELMKARAELAKTKIFAPFDGRLGIYMPGIAEGAHLNPHDVIVNYASGETDLVVDLFVSESDIPYLPEGKEVTGVISLCGQKVLIKGIVERINQGSDLSHSLQVRIGLNLKGTGSLPGPVLPGYSVTILCPVDTEEPLTSVDDRALQEAGESWYLAICTPTEDKDQNGRRIYVVNKQRVETGIRAGGRVSVNLPEGTLYTKARLLDGSKVTDKIEADSPKIPAQKSAVANETSGTNINTIDTEEEMDI